ncbi:helix-turn-helix transcriptional regulator [Larkinella soli]|uniref:helix-turn-helix transcriptional regulator n=1 Tax=Larkinella soli TaxID=1770527 RepID=UPI000FFB96E8|nr:helix-turn-helix transcriptional regulator [Larkinella soli]
MSIVSNNIKYLRRLNGLTQEQFARRIGIKRSLLGAYEEARANPNLDNLMAIARSFNTTVDNLLKSDLRKIRETPDLSIPLDRGFDERPAGGFAVPSSPLPKEVPEMAGPAPKPLAAVLEKFYQGPVTPPVIEKPRPAPAHQAINLVAQRIIPRPVSGREAFPRMPVMAPRPPQPLSFNNVYENSATSVGRPQADRRSPEEPHAPASIQYVRQAQFADYMHRYQQTDFLQRLPGFQLPMLPTGNYRAFEAGEEFAFPGALVVGQFVRNWYEIADGKWYILLVQGQGLAFRRVINQVKTKGSLLLTADQPSVPNREVPIREVQEVWEIRAFVSQQLPEPAPSLDGLRSLVDDLKFELDRLQKK